MPAEYVNKLARMFQDVKISEDINTDFKEMARNNQLESGTGTATPPFIYITLEYSGSSPETRDQYFKRVSLGRVSGTSAFKR